MFCCLNMANLHDHFELLNAFYMNSMGITIIIYAIMC